MTRKYSKYAAPPVRRQRVGPMGIRMALASSLRRGAAGRRSTAIEMAGAAQQLRVGSARRCWVVGRCVASDVGGRPAVRRCGAESRWAAAVGVSGAVAGLAGAAGGCAVADSAISVESAPRRVVTVGEYQFDDRLNVVSGKDEASSLSLKGPTGKDRVCRLTFWTFPIACAALYLPDEEVATPGKHGSVLNAAVPKVLKLQYLRAVSAKDFRESTLHFIRANKLLSERVESQLDHWNRLFRDVDVGDTYEVRAHVDETGVGRVELALNGAVLGEVSGRVAEFSTALFSVWFGDRYAATASVPCRSCATNL